MDRRTCFTDFVKASFEDFERADVVEAGYENFESSVIGFAASYFLSLVILY